MKITKIILFFASFILSFLLFNKDVFAVTFNGSNDVKLQSVAISNSFSGADMAWKTIWSFDYKNRINDIVGINCINYTGRNCTNYVLQTVQIFTINLNIDYSDSVLSNVYLLGKESYVNPRSEVMFKANWIYEDQEKKIGKKTLEIYYQLYNWDKKTIYEIDVNRKCGSDNPKVCVLAINSFWTYSSHPATTGVYLTYSDISLYNSAADKVLINRIHNKKSKLPEPGFFSWLSDFNIFGRLEKNNLSYGTRVADIEEGYFIYLQKDKNKAISDTGNNRSYKGIKYIKDEKTWDYYFSTIEEFTYDREISDWYYMHIPRISGSYVLTAWQFDDFVFENYRKLSPYFNKFLWGEFYKPIQDGTLIYTLQDIFWFNSSFFQQQGDANSQDNNSSDWLVENTCEWVDIWCHIKNLSVSIGRFLGNIWNWFADVIKGIFTWIWEGIKTITLPIQELFINIQNTIKQIFGFIQSIFIRDLNEHQKISCDANFNFAITEEERKKADIKFAQYVEENFSWVMDWVFAFSNNFITIIRFIDPVIPANWSEICTYAWVKRVDYSTNSFIDVFFVMTFVLGIISLFFYRNS